MFWCELLFEGAGSGQDGIHVPQPSGCLEEERKANAGRGARQITESSKVLNYCG